MKGFFIAKLAEKPYIHRHFPMRLSIQKLLVQIAYSIGEGKFALFPTRLSVEGVEG